MTNVLPAVASVVVLVAGASLLAGSSAVIVDRADDSKALEGRRSKVAYRVAADAGRGSYVIDGADQQHGQQAPQAGAVPSTAAVPPGSLFVESNTCLACHNGLFAADGEDISIGFDWRSSMMANAARDPYWHAGVRRESLDHPESQAAIEHECAACHMPATHYEAKLKDLQHSVFSHLPGARGMTPADVLSADGVSCTVCHRIENEKLGTRESFTAGFVVRPVAANAARTVFGPFTVDAGRTRVMESASGFQPANSMHIQKSEMCATCHTLFTHALGPGGEHLGELPEQVPYLEWLHSEYREKASCQSCHMPLVEGPAEISSVLGQPRQPVARHEFRGGNFLMPRILNRFAGELAVVALPQEFDTTSRNAMEHLRGASAKVTIDPARIEGARLVASVTVENLAGHKLPTAYPSRRAWLHFTVRDASGKVVFESGAVGAKGSIEGNDNDEDPSRFEPHYPEIDAPGKVQVYEPIMVDSKGAVTTGLLSGVRYAKDNRLLPRGFDKATAYADVAVRGDATADADFTAGRDTVRYAVGLGGAQGPFEIQAELLYQPIGYRWAQNLRGRNTAETDRFIGYWDKMASASSTLLATTQATVK